MLDHVLDTGATAADATLDADSRAWVERLSAAGVAKDEAVTELHRLLLRAARHEIARRASSWRHLGAAEREDLAQQSADDALVAVLAKLGEFRGYSRFTTWAYKFALYEAAVKLRRLAWRTREIPVEDEAWAVLADHRQGPDGDAETGELLTALREGIERHLTPHQRDVLVSLVLGGVPIDVLAERLNTTRGALYKTLHDARRKLRAHLEAQDLLPSRGDTP